MFFQKLYGLIIIVIKCYEEDKPIACVAIKKVSDETCEGKRLFIKPEYRGKGYARIMLKAMTDKAFEAMIRMSQ